MKRLIVLLVCIALLGGCGFAEKRKQADRIRSVPDKLAAIGTAKTEFSIGFKIVSTSAEAAGLSGGEVPATVVSGELDYAAHRTSALFALPGQEPVPVQLTDRTFLYQRRPTLPGASASRSQRAWRRIDLAALYDDRERMSKSAVGANFVGPATLIDLVRGALTGSVKIDGREEIRGVETTRYKMNIDLDKAFSDAPEELREAFAVSREVAGMKRLVHPGRVWLDADGVPRRVEVRLKQERSRRDAIELKLTLDIFELGAPVKIELPGADEVSTVKDIASYIQGQITDSQQVQASLTSSTTTTTVAP